MAIALVGSMGTVSTGTNSVSPSFAQSTTAGNLLVAWVMTDQLAANLPSGWSASAQDAAGHSLLWKENCAAGETAPTITATSLFIAARLGEYSGAATTTPEDKAGATTGTTSPDVVNASAADTQSGDLVVTVGNAVYSMAATKTTSDTYNNGATPTDSASNDATSSLYHYRFAWGLTTGNSVADQDSFAFTITNISSAGVLIQSFSPAPPVVPATPMVSNHLPFIPQGRSM